jgi:hypothetical protein
MRLPRREAAEVGLGAEEEEAGRSADDEEAARRGPVPFSRATLRSAAAQSVAATEQQCRSIMCRLLPLLPAPLDDEAAVPAVGTRAHVPLAPELKAMRLRSATSFAAVAVDAMAAEGATGRPLESHGMVSVSCGREETKAEASAEPTL